MFFFNFRPSNPHVRQSNQPSSLEGKQINPGADLMKSRIESFINHGEEDAELADRYLGKKEEIKQQRSGPKTSIGT